MNIHSTLQVCTDCLMLVANGDEPENPPCATCGHPHQGHRTTFHGAEVCDFCKCTGYKPGSLAERIVDYIGAQYAANLVCGDSENDNEFSIQPCGACGNKFHGKRHEMHILCNHEGCKRTDDGASKDE